MIIKASGPRLRFNSYDLQLLDCLQEIDFSFSPGFSLGISGALDQRNRFNGFQVSIGFRGMAGRHETVKTVR